MSHTTTSTYSLPSSSSNHSLHRESNASSPSSSFHNDRASQASHSSEEDLIFKSGFLKKKGLWGRWKESWFVINPNGNLTECKYKGGSDKTLKPSKEYPLAHSVIQEAELLCGAPNSFVMFFVRSSENNRSSNDGSPTGIASPTTSSHKKPERSKSSEKQQHFFQAPTKVECQEWISALRKFSKSGHSNSSNSGMDLEAFNDPVVLSDEKAFILEANKKALELFGWKKEEIYGKSVTVFIPNAVAARHDNYVNDYNQSGERRLIGKPRKMQAIKKDGSLFYIVLSLGETVSADGKKRYIATMRDISGDAVEFSAEMLQKQLEEKVELLSNDLKVQLKSAARDMCLNQVSLKTKNEQLRHKIETLEKELMHLGERLDREQKVKQLSHKALQQAIKVEGSYNESLTEQAKAIVTIEVTQCSSFPTLFREDSMNINKLTSFLILMGAEYLVATLGGPLNDIMRKKRSCEINPSLLQLELPEASAAELASQTEKRISRILKRSSKVLDAILNSADKVPPAFSELFIHIKLLIDRKFPTTNHKENHSHQAIGGLLFLRFLVPVVISPESYSLIDDDVRYSDNGKKSLLYVGKTLQHLSNGVPFSDKDSYLQPMNQFITAKNKAFREFIDKISS